MAANVETMLYVNETPWHGLGVKYDTPPNSTEEILKGAHLDWEVASSPMYAEINGEYQKIIPWSTIYRTDKNIPLGVIKKANPKTVQNRDMFSSMEDMLGKYVDTETAASLGNGETVFGCFKIKEQYNIFDDAIDHYYVIMNDHLAGDGKVTILNTPVRVVCQNTLSAALSSANMKMRIPVYQDTKMTSFLEPRIQEFAERGKNDLTKIAERFVKQKVDRTYVERLMDELFPYIQTDENAESSHDRANDRTTMIRDTFTECLAADNLGNYRGTAWQVYNALTDFHQHYHSSIDKAYDLNYRMGLLPGTKIYSAQDLVGKFLKFNKQVA